MSELVKRIDDVENRVNSLSKEVNQIHRKLLPPSVKGALVTCNCGYKWRTKSYHALVSCPDCGSKVKNKKRDNLDEAWDKAET